MEEVAAVRRAALDAVDDVGPATLAERLTERLEDGSVAPGVLTLRSASAAGDGVRPDDVAERGAAVQLIYEGLRLTRTLAHDEPWSDAAGEGDDPDSPAARADVDILVADILVARGFYLLARTEAADTAVGVVRSFGRDQTVRDRTDDPSLDANLEADVLELAVVAGTTATGAAPPVNRREFVLELVDGADFPSVATLGSESVAERLAGLVGPDATPTEGARPSADH